MIGFGLDVGYEMERVVSENGVELVLIEALDGRLVLKLPSETRLPMFQAKINRLQSILETLKGMLIDGEFVLINSKDIGLVLAESNAGFVKVVSTRHLWVAQENTAPVTCEVARKLICDQIDITLNMLERLENH